jgi:hypothetical protein
MVAVGLLALPACGRSGRNEGAVCELDDDCADDFRCDPVAKVCARTCADSTACTAPQTCDTAAGLCRAAPATDCRQGGAQACTGAQTCNQSTGQCEAPTDCRQGGAQACTGAQTCNQSTGQCEGGATDCRQGGAQACTGAQTCNQSTGQCEAPTDCRQGGAQACTGTDVCDPSTGQCLGRCDDTGATPCGPGQACDPGTHLCTLTCTDNAGCTDETRPFCNTANIRCEALDDISTCGTPTLASRRYVSPATNACVSVAELATCPSAANRDALQPEVADGPTAYRIRQTGYVASSPSCSGNASVELTVSFYDPSGGMLENGQIPNRAVIQSVGDTTPNDDSFALSGLTSSTGTTDTRGDVTFRVCRAAGADATGTGAVYLQDAEGHYGNTVCYDIDANQLNP